MRQKTTSTNMIVVVSDLHLGINDTYSQNIENRTLFVRFLKDMSQAEDLTEIIINGDFLDEWYLPLNFPVYTNSDDFYIQALENNHEIVEALNEVISMGIKVTFIPGNHDMLLSKDVLTKVIPDINFVDNEIGMGRYRTGYNNEILVEHGHRYDVFSAPYLMQSEETGGTSETILPPGYFHIRLFADYYFRGRAKSTMELPLLEEVPDYNTNPEEFDAYIYQKIWYNSLKRIAPKVAFDEKCIDVRINGFNDKFSIKDIYPDIQEDGSLSSPYLYKNIHKNWKAAQLKNNVNRCTSFAKSIKGTLYGEYYLKQAKRQYFKNRNDNVDIVVFGHTHVPQYVYLEDENKTYVNCGSWIDKNSRYPHCTFASIISRPDGSEVELYEYHSEGFIKQIY